jgi:hypothetical protein
LIPKRIENVDLADIDSLIQAGVPEGRTIEYKRDVPSGSDGDKKEFLADVSSFANAEGGDLVFGVMESQGLPTELVGVADDDIDAIILRLENLIRDGIQPRVSVVTKRIGSDHPVVILMRIHRSWNKPHRVVFKGHDKFYSRNSAGKYPMDVPELRGAFLGSHELSSRIRELVAQRNDAVYRNEAQFPLPNSGRMILQIVPFGVLDTESPLAIQQLLGLDLWPIYTSGCDRRVNIDGVVAYSPSTTVPVSTYTQIYRNGAIEAVCASLLQGHDGEPPFIPSQAYELELTKALQAYVHVLRSLGQL